MKGARLTNEPRLEKGCQPTNGFGLKEEGARLTDEPRLEKGANQLTGLDLRIKVSFERPLFFF